MKSLLSKLFTPNVKKLRRRGDIQGLIGALRNSKTTEEGTVALIESAQSEAYEALLEYTVRRLWGVLLTWQVAAVYGTIRSNIHSLAIDNPMGLELLLSLRDPGVRDEALDEAIVSASLKLRPEDRDRLILVVMHNPVKDWTWFEYKRTNCLWLLARTASEHTIPILIDSADLDVARYETEVWHVVWGAIAMLSSTETFAQRRQQLVECAIRKTIEGKGEAGALEFLAQFGDGSALAALILLSDPPGVSFLDAWFDHVDPSSNTFAQALKNLQQSLGLSTRDFVNQFSFSPVLRDQRQEALKRLARRAGQSGMRIIEDAIRCGDSHIGVCARSVRDFLLRE